MPTGISLFVAIGYPTVMLALLGPVFLGRDEWRVPALFAAAFILAAAAGYVTYPNLHIWH